MLWGMLAASVCSSREGGRQAGTHPAAVPDCLPPCCAMINHHSSVCSMLQCMGVLQLLVAPRVLSGVLQPVTLAHVVATWLLRMLQVFQPVPAQLDDMAAFHNREYLEYLTVADRGKVCMERGGQRTCSRAAHKEGAEQAAGQRQGWEGHT